MKAALSSDIREVIDAVHYRPAVSIILPFEPKINARTELEQQLKFAIDEVEREIKKDYRDELAATVVQKLKRIVKDLNFSTSKKSVAVYVSPVFEKVIYLDIPAMQKVMVDDSFEIRDLLQDKKELHEYLVLVVSSKWSRIYAGNYASFRKVAAHVPGQVAVFANEPPERVGNFSDPSSRKEKLLEKFLHHIDEGLRSILQEYPLPVFVLGAKRVLGHFKALTKNEKQIAGYISGNYEDSTASALSKLLAPHIGAAKKAKMESLRSQAEKAADAGKLATGMKEVWKSAMQRKGRLLIVERNFMFAGDHGGGEDELLPADGLRKQFSSIKDAVDDVIEKVLIHGGDVEFVEEGFLRDFGHIALIRYY